MAKFFDKMFTFNFERYPVKKLYWNPFFLVMNQKKFSTSFMRVPIFLDTPQNESLTLFTSGKVLFTIKKKA